MACLENLNQDVMTLMCWRKFTSVKLHPTLNQDISGRLRRQSLDKFILLKQNKITKSILRSLEDTVSRNNQ